MSAVDDLVVCETVAAITTHLRRVTPGHPVRLSGRPSPQPLTLCGNKAAWDTRIPVRRQDRGGSVDVGCRDCMLAWRGP